MFLITLYVSLFSSHCLPFRQIDATRRPPPPPSKPTPRTVMCERAVNARQTTTTSKIYIIKRILIQNYYHCSNSNSDFYTNGLPACYGVHRTSHFLPLFSYASFRRVSFAPPCPPVGLPPRGGPFHPLGPPPRSRTMSFKPFCEMTSKSVSMQNKLWLPLKVNGLYNNVYFMRKYLILIYPAFKTDEKDIWYERWQDGKIKTVLPCWHILSAKLGAVAVAFFSLPSIVLHRKALTGKYLKKKKEEAEK